MDPFEYKGRVVRCHRGHRRAGIAHGDPCPTGEQAESGNVMVVTAVQVGEGFRPRDASFAKSKAGQQEEAPWAAAYSFRWGDWF